VSPAETNRITALILSIGLKRRNEKSRTAKRRPFRV
jgi:hypothetical protein